MQPSDEGPSSRITSTPAGLLQFTPPTWYEGIVPQQNGLWSAQINFNGSLVLLGTFKSEVAAARAYDSAGTKLKGGDFYRNFLLTNVTIHESYFQSSYSNEAIMDMIRDGSYERKLIDTVWSQQRQYQYIGYLAMPTCLDAIPGFVFEEMFHKKLILNGIEGQNILVLPHQARSYYPPFKSTGGLPLVFRDRVNRPWEFQYCYNNSTQSYIFNMGWSKFANEMELRTKDTVVFYRCMDWRNFPPKNFDMVDIIRDANPKKPRRR
ncbi:AP2/ERF and B3 domain-containing transcription factor At1g51120-like isoform X2 [Phalaenopsis equestris]|uniref:AP2/ERF and B3 domain-containing transcription factor At1g51120-like isoform X2 n=1 Tax=Phalaenopsis equestris TaxID=78828 RepID=UPI0009E64256|nr:AP2/ERF and B3 domain-containing transcription factor At1g51120-like isoform X2 [Phalaenopsis equestris]